MANLQIKINDDKKQKYQSFTASANLELPHLFNSEVEAYGASEREATDNLMLMLSDIATDISNKLKRPIDSDKRQPIKEKTLDEFNNAQQVAYGSNVQVELLTESVVVKNGYNFDNVSVSNIDTDKMKNLIK